MKKVLFFAASILISASAYASEQDFPAFLKDYSAFKSQRDAQTQRHTARFFGKLAFKEQCSFYSQPSAIPVMNSDPSDGSCECPQGNKYLQCLESAQAIVKADPNDIGGKGYVQILSEGSVLNRSGVWVPVTQVGVYTTTMTPVKATNIINIPLPDLATMEHLCAARSDKPVVLTVGYGAVMPMDMEFARRMKIRSAELGQEFDEEGFIFSRARINGVRPSKAGNIGTIECRPTDAGG